MQMREKTNRNRGEVRIIAPDFRTLLPPSPTPSERHCGELPHKAESIFFNLRTLFAILRFFAPCALAIFLLSRLIWSRNFSFFEGPRLPDPSIVKLYGIPGANPRTRR